VNPPDRDRIEDALGRLFDGIFRLSDPELRMIRTIWESEDKDARQKAFQTARAVIDQRHRRYLLDEAQSTIRQWMGSYLTATTGEYGAFLTGARAGMDIGEVRRDLVPPLIDAVVAIIAADGLPADERELLLEPVTHVVAQHERPSA
jgi:hypothetical protein